MCAAAQARVAARGLADRIEIVCGDARDLPSLLGDDVLDEIDVVHCKGLMNELFGNGDSDAVAYLSVLRSLFPDRLLLNVEYYGKLGLVYGVDSRYRHTLVHDVVQQLTGQGVQPSDRDGWDRVYRAAGAALEHAFEGDESGIEWCVHVVRL